MFLEPGDSHTRLVWCQVARRVYDLSQRHRKVVHRPKTADLSVILIADLTRLLLVEEACPIGEVGNLDPCCRDQQLYDSLLWEWLVQQR